MTSTDSPPPSTHGPISAADRQAFDTLVQEALPGVRSMAAAWRTGLTGLVTLVTTGIVLTGRSTASTLTTSWRAAITLTVGAGLAAAVVGLWHTLAAEVGTRTRLHTLTDMRSRYASVEAYKVGLAAAAGRRLRTARGFVAAALGLLLTGVLLTWWAPPAPTSPPAYLEVTRSSGDVACGVLASGDAGVIRLTVAGSHEPVVIPLSTVTNMAVTATCT